MSLEQSAGRLSGVQRRDVTNDATAHRVLTGLRGHWAVAVVLLLFAGAAAIVPTLAPVATTDDWAYARSAQILLSEGRLTIFPVVAATAVFQVVWGALFGLLFGPTLGIFRLSTVVITGLGAIALYLLCRDLGVSPGRGALGVATYLANPLVFILSFTFMTDAHFVALLLLATWLFARAIELSAISYQLSAISYQLSAMDEAQDGVQSTEDFPSPVTPIPIAHHLSPVTLDSRYLIAGSAVAGLAFLARQQGALIVPMVVLFLIVTKRLRFDRAGVVTFLQVTVIPALTLVGYYLWLRFGNDVPHVQESFFREVLEEGWSGTWWLLRHLTVIELIYLGFFTLPLMAAALPFARQIAHGISRWGWVLFALWAAIAVVGVVIFWRNGARMPYIPQFFGAGGLGPPDVLGSRPRFITPEMRGALTAVCLGAALLLGLVAARVVSGANSDSPHATERPSPSALGKGFGVRESKWLEVRHTRSARAGLVFSIAMGQVIGVLPPSYHYIGWTAGSLDRYLLPLAPLVIALALWGLRGVRLALPLGWVLAAALALFSIAGTRDYLVFMRDVWTMGDRALAAGVPLERLDAGSAWDGYHLYERGLEERIRSRTPKGGPWWVYFYAPATDSAYVVASKPQKGRVVVMTKTFTPWLGPPTTISLQRRWGAPWPVRNVLREWAERLQPGRGVDDRVAPPALPVQDTPVSLEAEND